MVKYHAEKVSFKLETLTAGIIPGIRVLCPTRWTGELSITRNYSVLHSTREEALLNVIDSETKARIQGVSSQMKTFNYSYIYGCALSELILRHTI